MYSKGKGASAPSDGQARDKLVMYVYEYLCHIGAQKAAQTFLSEIRWDKAINIADPPGFLLSWWCVFWDLYCAAPERRDSYDHSSEAKAFHDYGFVNSGFPMNGMAPTANDSPMAPVEGMPGSGPPGGMPVFFSPGGAHAIHNGQPSPHGAGPVAPQFVARNGFGPPNASIVPGPMMPHRLTPAPAAQGPMPPHLRLQHDYNGPMGAPGGCLIPANVGPHGAVDPLSGRPVGGPGRMDEWLAGPGGAPLMAGPPMMRGIARLPAPHGPVPVGFGQQMVRVGPDHTPPCSLGGMSPAAPPPPMAAPRIPPHQWPPHAAYPPTPPGPHFNGMIHIGSSPQEMPAGCGPFSMNPAPSLMLPHDHPAMVSASANHALLSRGLSHPGHVELLEHGMLPHGGRDVTDGSCNGAVTMGPPDQPDLLDHSHALGVAFATGPPNFAFADDSRESAEAIMKIKESLQQHHEAIPSVN